MTAGHGSAALVKDEAGHLATFAGDELHLGFDRAEEEARGGCSEDAEPGLIGGPGVKLVGLTRDGDRERGRELVAADVALEHFHRHAHRGARRRRVPNRRARVQHMDGDVVDVRGGVRQYQYVGAGLGIDADEGVVAAGLTIVPGELATIVLQHVPAKSDPQSRRAAPSV